MSVPLDRNNAQVKKFINDHLTKLQGFVERLQDREDGQPFKQEVIYQVARVAYNDDFDPVLRDVSMIFITVIMNSQWNAILPLSKFLDYIFNADKELGFDEHQFDKIEGRRQQFIKYLVKQKIEIPLSQLFRKLRQHEMKNVGESGDNQVEGDGLKLQQFFKYRRRWRRKPGGDQLKKSLAKMDVLIKKFDEEWPLMDEEYLNIPSEEETDEDEDSVSSSSASSTSTENKISNSENVPPQNGTVNLLNLPKIFETASPTVKIASKPPMPPLPPSLAKKSTVPPPPLPPTTQSSQIPDKSKRIDAISESSDLQIVEPDIKSKIGEIKAEGIQSDLKSDLKSGQKSESTQKTETLDIQSPNVLLPPPPPDFESPEHANKMGDSSDSTDFTPLNSEDEQLEISPIKPKKATLRLKNKHLEEKENSDDEDFEQDNALNHRIANLNKQLKTKKFDKNNELNASDDDISENKDDMQVESEDNSEVEDVKFDRACDTADLRIQFTKSTANQVNMYHEYSKTAQSQTTHITMLPRATQVNIEQEQKGQNLKSIAIQTDVTAFQTTPEQQNKYLTNISLTVLEEILTLVTEQKSCDYEIRFSFSENSNENFISHPDNQSKIVEVIPDITKHFPGCRILDDQILHYGVHRLLVSVFSNTLASMIDNNEDEEMDKSGQGADLSWSDYETLVGACSIIYYFYTRKIIFNKVQECAKSIWEFRHKRMYDVGQSENQAEENMDRIENSHTIFVKILGKIIDIGNKLDVKHLIVPLSELPSLIQILGQSKNEKDWQKLYEYRIIGGHLSGPSIHKNYASLSLGGSGHIISNMSTPQVVHDVGSRTSSIVTGQSDVQVVNSVQGSVHNSVHNSVQNSVQNSVHNSVQNSVANFGQNTAHNTSIQTQNSLNSSILNNSLSLKTNKKKKKKKKSANIENDQVLPQTPDAKNKRKFSASDAFDSAFSNEKNNDRSFTSSQATNLNKPKPVMKIVLPPKDNSNTPKESKLEAKLDGNKSEITPTPSHAPSEISHKADQSMEDPFAEPYLDESIGGRKRIRSGDGVVEMPIKKKSKKEKKKINYVIDSDEEDLPIVIKKPKKLRKDKKEKVLEKKIADKKELKPKKAVEKSKSDKKKAKTIEIPDSPITCIKENPDLKLVIKLNTDPAKSETKSVSPKSPVKKLSMIDEKLEALKKDWNKPNTERLVANTLDANTLDTNTLDTNTPNAKPPNAKKSSVTKSRETEKPVSKPLDSKIPVTQSNKTEHEKMLDNLENVISNTGENDSDAHERILEEVEAIKDAEDDINRRKSFEKSSSASDQEIFSKVDATPAITEPASFDSMNVSQASTADFSRIEPMQEEVNNVIVSDLGKEKVKIEENDVEVKAIPTKRGRPKRTSVPPKKLADSVLETDELDEETITTTPAKRGRPGRKSSRTTPLPPPVDTPDKKTSITPEPSTTTAKTQTTTKTVKNTAKSSAKTAQTVPKTAPKIATKQAAKAVPKATPKTAAKTTPKPAPKAPKLAFKSSVSKEQSEKEPKKEAEPEAKAEPKIEAPKINASEVAKVQSGKGRRSKASLASLLAASIKGTTPAPVSSRTTPSPTRQTPTSTGAHTHRTTSAESQNSESTTETSNRDIATTPVEERAFTCTRNETTRQSHLQLIPGKQHKLRGHKNLLEFHTTSTFEFSDKKIHRQSVFDN